MSLEEQSPLVSIVIPTYNQSGFLADAVQSALTQTYSYFEIIIVDDGSTDDTPLIVQKFGNSVRYIRQDNQGLAGARNTGICSSRGQFIALLDSDDMWLPSFLEEMMLLAKQNPDATVYYCGWRYVASDGQILPQAPHGRVVPSCEMYESLLRVNFIIPSTIIMKRIQVIEAGLFDPSFRRLQDWEFWLRLLKGGYVFVGTSACLVHYRLHSRALTIDTVGGQGAALAMAEKHFGRDDGLWQIWSQDKRRAYGGIYRYAAIISLQHQHDWQSCVDYLSKAFQVDPSLVKDIDLFYDLALGSQPVGFRGTSQFQNFDNNAVQAEKLITEVLIRLNALPKNKIYNEMFGAIFYALGLVAYNLDQRYISRQYLLKALWCRPGLLRDNRIAGILIRSFISKKTISILRKILIDTKRRYRTNI